MRHSLFSEAFEPVFIEHPDAHIVLMATIDIQKSRDPLAEVRTQSFKGANTLFLLKPGDIALVTAGQFKIGRMGSKPEGGGGQDRKKKRRGSYMPSENRMSVHAYMTGECLGPSGRPTEIVTITERVCELLVIPASDVAEFSPSTLEALERLTTISHADVLAETAESGAERLDRVCREFFQKCDEDESGSISPLEFSRELRKQGKKFGPQFKDWFSRPLIIFEQIDDDGSGTIEEEEFVSYVKEKGDAMLLGLVMGSVAREDTFAAKNAEVAQREATDALVESLRERVMDLENTLRGERDSRLAERTDLFMGVMKAAMWKGDGEE